MKILILISVLGIISMISEIFNFRKFIWSISIVGLIASFILNLLEWNTFIRYYNDMIFVDNYAVAFGGLLLIFTIIWFLLSKDQYETGEFNKSDHFALILFSLVGGLVLVSFSDLSMLFLGIEILSIPLYILAGSRKNDLASNEASMKYFMMGAFATGILLFGIALIYGASGSFNLNIISQYTTEHAGQLPPIFYPGVLLILVGLCFKVSAAPFHFWSPDVYEGSPVFITAYMATIVKTAAFAAFYRLFSISFSEVGGVIPLVMTIIIALTIAIGNILAVYQTSAKRLLAYSGIAQAGYLLLNILVLNDKTSNSLWFYSASYGFSTLAAFAVIYWVIKIKGNDSFESFNSLSKSHPLLSFVLTLSLISLAGIPPAVGFFAKFYLFTVVVEAGYLPIVILALLGSIISIYYYFKLIIAMYARPGVDVLYSINFSYQTIFVFLIILIITLGIAPNFFLNILPQ